MDNKNDTKPVKKAVKVEDKKVVVKEVVVEKKAGFNYAEVIVIMIITLIIGGAVGAFLTKFNDTDKKTAEETTKVPSGMDEFLKTYNNILNDYYEKVDADKLLEAGINGMLEYLDDDYSVYMNEEASESFNEQVEGKYRGIGVEIISVEDMGVIINRVFDGSPAKKAGLKPGDIFIKVNGEDVTNKTSSDISKLIRNDEDGEVSVTVKRNEEEIESIIKLSTVDIESVSSKVFEENGKKIGYIRISIFADNTYLQFEKKLLELETKKIDKLIIDVRDNSGGYLTTVTDIASLFLNKGKVIYQLDTKGIVEQIYDKTKINRDYEVVVLTNKNSASASEILAAALQESYGAKVVGTQTFGKGTVQTAYQLKSGATVKYTIQKWLTPKGNWINEKGVKPDIEVELSEDYFNNPSDDTDNQLRKAIEELSK